MEQLLKNITTLKKLGQIKNKLLLYVNSVIDVKPTPLIGGRKLIKSSEKVF